MSLWPVVLKPEALKDLEALGKTVQESVVSKLQWFADNIDSVAHFRLKDSFSEFYKLRVGDWRVLYKLNHKTFSLEAYHINHRSKVYKKK
jgi:mRNA interferase RelE/StbE